jgi:hypothetical protein
VPDRAEPDGAPQSQKPALLDDVVMTSVATAAIEDGNPLLHSYLWIPIMRTAIWRTPSIYNAGNMTSIYSFFTR